MTYARKAIRLGRRSVSAFYGYASFRSIRGRILVAFLLTAITTACLAAYGNMSIRLAGELARKTYDQSLMSINYARAAAADFAAMRADYGRLSMIEDEKQRVALQSRAVKLSKSLSDDLRVAAQRSQSALAKVAAEKAREAAATWVQMSEHVLDQTRTRRELGCPRQNRRKS